jgi:endoglucanase
MTRREFIGASAAAAAGACLPAGLRGQPAAAPRSQPRIPRWRGFNLTELAGVADPSRPRHVRPYRQSDFQWMSEWGFTFARLPLSYWVWSSPWDWMTIDPGALRPIDQALELGEKHGIHICLSFHRIPGYCVNGREHEPYQLFGSSPDTMQPALDAALHHWRFFAERYRAVPSTRLSFDLMNEPPFMADQSRYVEIAVALIAAIRSASPDRLIFADGADIGQTPVPGLIDQGIVQSTHDYQPKMVTHYTAGWVPASEFESLEKPTWPMLDRHGVRWDREKLRAEVIAKWKPLTDVGAPVHVGEWGCFNKTPHDVCLGWMGDVLSLWKEAGWGWSMWNLRGAFGIVDSGRSDVAYEDFRGHKLDRRMLELLLADGAPR